MDKKAPTIAFFPMVVNTVAGLKSLDADTESLALSLRASRWKVLTYFKLPNALPLALTGVRLSAVLVVATATLGAYVGFGCLGSFINEGFRQRDTGALLTGAVLVAALAILTELAFGVLQRTVTPWLSNTKGNR